VGAIAPSKKRGQEERVSSGRKDLVSREKAGMLFGTWKIKEQGGPWQYRIVKESSSKKNGRL